MTKPEDLQLPRDQGPVPEALRDAFGWVRDAERASAAPGAPAADALATIADDAAGDEERLALVEQLLATREGARDLAHLIAARASTEAASAYFSSAPVEPTAPPRGFADVRYDAPRSRFASLKPVLLAASLMLVAGTSWYVYSMPAVPVGDEIRAAGTMVELLAVQPMPASSPITLAWKRLRADDRYTVEVLDATDAPVFNGDTHTTRVVIPAGTLKPGTYRWFVRARGTDRSEIRSRVESFSVR